MFVCNQSIHLIVFRGMLTVLECISCTICCRGYVNRLADFYSLTFCYSVEEARPRMQLGNSETRLRNRNIRPYGCTYITSISISCAPINFESILCRARHLTVPAISIQLPSKESAQPLLLILDYRWPARYPAMLFSRAQVLISNDDLHAVVSICSIVLLILAVLSTLGRIFTKLSVVHKVALDDYTAFLALVSSICQVRLEI